MRHQSNRHTPSLQTLREVLAKSLVAYATQLDASLAHIDTRNNPEDVHSARVWSRRLRNALKATGHFWQQEALEGFARRVKGITRILGPARDLDVILHFAGVWPPCGSPVERICRDQVRAFIREQRQRQTSRLAWLLNETRRRPVGKHVARLVQAPVGLEAGFARQALRASSISLVRKLARRVARAYTRPTVRRLHKVRLALRPLRYTAELFGPFGPKKWQRIEAACHHWQDRIGLLHDGHQLLLTYHSLMDEIGNLHPLVQWRRVGLSPELFFAVLSRRMGTMEYEQLQRCRQLSRELRRALSRRTLAGWTDTARQTFGRIERP